MSSRSPIIFALLRHALRMGCTRLVGNYPKSGWRAARANLNSKHMDAFLNSDGSNPKLSFCLSYAPSESYELCCDVIFIVRGNFYFSHCCFDVVQCLIGHICLENLSLGN